MIPASALAILLLAAAPPAALSQVATQEHRVRLVTVATGLEYPWSLAFLPDGRMLVTERPGRLRVLTKDGRLDPKPVEGLPRVDPQGQGGLMDVVLHPDYARNGWVYWTYTQRGGGNGNGTELARGKLAGGPGNYRMEQVQVLFRMQPKTSTGRHFGSRLVFDRDGALYMTLGDRGEQDKAQDLADHRGKILRLSEDGKPAPRNPFLDRANARPEIFSYGHRNVQGAALHPGTGALWVAEHGPQGGDELNLVRAGVNYGWPVITYGVNYGIGTKIGEGTSKPGMAQPQKHWIPSPALSGMAFYQGDKFPRWRGDLLIGALRGQALIRVRLDSERVAADEFLLNGALPRIRDVRVGPDGHVYLLGDQSDGSVLRLEPAD
ncbi:MAG TPA: PQQ-dependent sugar dehydrogenase [Burkholderiaceae bacterium]|nr:PQQ-dependent sugar dehydrogenase [Burkholderiaceae bacterium]